MCSHISQATSASGLSDEITMCLGGHLHLYQVPCMYLSWNISKNSVSCGKDTFYLKVSQKTGKPEHHRGQLLSCTCSDISEGDMKTVKPVLSTLTPQYYQIKIILNDNKLLLFCLIHYHCFVFLPLAEKDDKSEKATNQGPQFTSGVIMKITDNKPLPGRKFIKVQYNSKIIIICIWFQIIQK